MTDHSINLTDVTRQPYPEPCPDCGRKHMNGEHISLTVPASDGGTRTVWEGCAGCWVKRTDPATPEHDRQVIEKFLRERDTPSVRIENPDMLLALMAKAWDEGHTAGVRNASAEFDGPAQDNPYERTDRIEAGETDADA